MRDLHYFSVLASLLCALLCFGGIASGSLGLAQRWFGTERTSTRLSAAGLMAIAFVVVVVQFLGAIRTLQAWPAALLCSAFAALCGGRTRPGAGDSLGVVCTADPTGGLFKACLAWLRGRTSDGHGVFFCVVAVLVTQAVMRGLRCPPLSWDSLTYHAFLPARWVQLGSLAPFAAPGGMDGYRALPCNMEYLVAFVMLPFKTDLLVNLTNPMVMLFAAVVAYSLARQLGASEGLGLGAAGLFCFSPTVWSLVTTQYNDVLVAAMLGAGLLFLIRHFETGRRVDLFLSAASIGLACGTKYTALPMAAFVLLILLVRRAVRREGLWNVLPTWATCAVIALALGGGKYIENWIHLENPVYPFKVAIAGRTLFEGSPMHEEWASELEQDATGSDARVLEYFVSSRPYAWGPKFIVLLPMACWLAIRPGPRREAVWLVGGVCLFELLSLWAPTGGVMGHSRRAFPETFCRMQTFPMLLVSCMAAFQIGRLGVPIVVAGLLLALVALFDYRSGAYPQPLSFNETAWVLAIAVGVMWMVMTRGESLIRPMKRLHRPALGVATVAALLFIPVLLARIQAKRDRDRHHHYARSIDFHDIPRTWTDGWQACDDAGTPHVIAFGRRHKPDDVESMLRINTGWFFYPLLGSRLQNRVVFASLHESSDLPSKPFRAALADGTREEIWLGNLERLGVDRLFVAKGAWPEEAWIQRRPGLFKALHRGADCTVYEVGPNSVLRQALLAAADERE